MVGKIMNSGFRDWSPKQLPDLSGKTFLITGANSGIGFEAAKVLAENRANIILACRSKPKANQAITALQNINVVGKIDFVELDLSSLASVKKASEEIHARYTKIDCLINNAGIMQTPETRTVDGYELQLATNHLGHFLLTGLLFDLVEAARGRITVVASIAHKFGKINKADLMHEQSYAAMEAYGQSKLANVLFAQELHRKLEDIGSSVTCTACHPGYSSTNLQSTGPSGIWNLIYPFMNAVMAQPSYRGAIPTLLAAASTEAKPGGYYGPQSLGEMRGRVSDAIFSNEALDKGMAAWLWKESERLTGFRWPSLEAKVA